MLFYFFFGLVAGAFIIKRSLKTYRFTNRISIFSLIGSVILTYVISILFFFLGTLITTYSHASEVKGQDLLSKTTVMVSGLGCSGSGSVVEGKSGKKYILTNAHVCNCAGYKNQIFTTFEGGEVLKGEIKQKSWEYDLCAAEVKEDRVALKLAFQLLPFTEVNTQGYPAMRLAKSHGLVKGNEEWAAVMGIEELGVCPAGARRGYGLNGNLAYCQMLFTSTRTSLYARPGSSGSPVVNDNGELVGVISSFLPDDEYDAGMVPFNQLRSFIETL